MGLAEDQGRPGRGSEGGGQTREVDLTTFIIGFHLASQPDLPRQGDPDRVYRPDIHTRDVSAGGVTRRWV